MGKKTGNRPDAWLAIQTFSMLEYQTNPGTQSAWVGDRVPLARVNSETTLFLFLFVLTRTLHYARHTAHYARASMERRQSLFQDKGTDRLQRVERGTSQSSNHLEGELITRFTGSTGREEFPSGRHHHLSAEVLLRMRREVGGLPKRVLVERITRNAQPPFGRRHYRLAVVP